MIFSILYLFSDNNLDNFININISGFTDSNKNI